MMKTNIALGFKTAYGDAGLAQFASNIAGRMSGNPKFDPLKPLVETQLQTVLSRFQQALNDAADGSRTKIAEKRELRAQLLQILENITVHLPTLPGVSDALVLEAGFAPRRRAQRNVGAIGQVTGLRAVTGSAGEALLTFDAVAYARVYGVEYSLDGGKTWQSGGVTTSRRAVVRNLPDHQLILFRVFAIGSQQREGVRSAPVELFIT